MKLRHKKKKDGKVQFAAKKFTIHLQTNKKINQLYSNKFTEWWYINIKSENDKFEVKERELKIKIEIAIGVLHGLLG